MTARRERYVDPPQSRPLHQDRTRLASIVSANSTPSAWLARRLAPQGAPALTARYLGYEAAGCLSLEPGPLISDDVEIELNLDAEHGWVRVDPTQLEQIIVNLAVNARDAMPHGGELTISVHDVSPTDAARPDPDLSAGPFVRIAITDTGTGMDEATRVRIFDPFFTTKAPGQGTGLGLSTVFKIVAQSGGQIQGETTPGRGSTFNIDLPRVERTVAPRPDPLEAPLHASGVVLLVEDEPSVREFARRGLESAGYTVQEAQP
jgi:signal transduction histidine kinase